MASARETYVTGTGQRIEGVHPRSADCDRHGCAIHNPTDHPLRDWPTNWRADMRTMERICEHGIGHPDPDDLAYRRRTAGVAATRMDGVHGCDGCCMPEFDGREPDRQVELGYCETRVAADMRLEFHGTLGAAAEAAGGWLQMAGTLRWSELVALRAQVEPQLLGPVELDLRMAHFRIADADRCWGADDRR